MHLYWWENPIRSRAHGYRLSWGNKHPRSIWGTSNIALPQGAQPHCAAMQAAHGPAAFKQAIQKVQQRKQRHTDYQYKKN